MTSSTRWFALATLALSDFINTVVADPPQGLEPTRHNERRLQTLNIRQGNKRITDEITATVAPDSICGFYMPQTQFSFTCEPGTSCMFEQDRYNIAFCGETDFKLGCYDRDDTLDDQICDEECRKSPNNYFCTNQARPFCYTIYFPDDIKKYACHTISGFSSMVFPDEASTWGTSLIDVAVIPLTTTTESSAESTEPSTTTESSSQSSSTTTNPAVNTDPPDDNDDNETPVGAIAGGVVGGVVVIAAIVCGVFFIRRRTKTKEAQPMQQASAQAPTAPAAPYYPDQQQQQQYQYQQAPMHPPTTFPMQSPPLMQQQSSPDPWGSYKQTPSSANNAPIIFEAPGHESNPVPIYEMGDKADVNK